MVEAGESVSMVLKKEFAEEAMNMLEQTETQKQHTKKVIEDFFKGGTEVRYVKQRNKIWVAIWPGMEAYTGHLVVLLYLKIVK